MKCRMLAAVVLSALAGCASSSPAPAELALSDAPLAGRDAVLTVYGMSCPLCANNVDRSLMDVPGVSGVRVDMSTGKAHVALDGRTPVSSRQLAEAVDRSGFTLREISGQ